MPTKMLRPNVGIYVATSDAFLDYKNPTLAELGVGTKVFNISPAITDGYTLNLTDSDIDSSLSMTDAAQVSTPTLYNYEASFDGFRDSTANAVSPTANVYNKFRDLFQASPVGTKYFLVKRIGKPHGDSIVAGDIVSVFGVTTDYAVDIVADGAMILTGARFLTTGEVAVNVTIGAGTAAIPTLASTVGTKIQSNGNLAVAWIPLANISSETTFMSAPTAALLNGGTTLTSAIAWDGYELTSSDSNKIDDKGIIDLANAQNRGFAQFSGSLTFFRGKYPTAAYASTGASGASVITITTPANAAFVEVGMAVSGTGVGVGAVVTSVNTTTGAIGVSVVNSGAISSSITFKSSYASAYDLFKAATNARPSGYLAVRVGAGNGLFAANDKVNIFKFVADAVMDNTEGEDSVKFSVKFQPQGIASVSVTAS